MFGSLAKTRGRHRFFTSGVDHFLCLRALSSVAHHAAEIAEVLEAIGQIDEALPESWRTTWATLAQRVETGAEAIRDPLARGRAFFRASVYYRTAEVKLSPGDDQRGALFGQSVEAFHTGLNTLGIRHQRLRVPYGEHRLNALYFPAGGGISADNRPLIVAHGGLDATLGELYFTIVAACQERGYSALIYEGPGQGVVLREQGLPLIPQWEKPTAAVLDAFLAKHPTGQQIVLLGFSLGGLLALRAAAFDARIDGVATLSAPYDCGDIADGLIPRRMRDMDAGRWLVAKLLARRAKHDPGFRLATNLLPFAMGASDVLSAARNFKEFGLDGAASLIRQPVLIMAGAEDPLVPLGQTQKLEAALSGAASVTPRLYPREMGGAEHCQMGTFSHWQADFFDWLADTF